MKLRWVAGLALAVVLTACSNDDPEVHTIAFLRAVPGAPSTEPALLEELRRAGFVQGRNLEVLALDPDIAHPDEASARQAIDEWLDQGVDLILALSTSGAAIARDAAPDTDVLFISNDPTATGLVTDEAAPEGRLTGVSFRVPADRTLALAGRLVPGLSTIGLVVPAGDPAAEANRSLLEEAALQLDLTLVVEVFAEPDQLDGAVDAVVADGAELLVLSTSPLATRVLDETAAAAARHRIPVVANTSLAEFAVLSLSPDVDELGRQLGQQAARLLSGSLPASLAVEDPGRFVLTVNARAAAELDLEVPDSVIREARTVLQ